MKNLLLAAILLFICACTGTRFEYNDGQDGSKEMVSYKTYGLFFDDEEKLKLKISSINGSQIEGISWEGRKILAVEENYPNDEFSFKNLNASIIDDGEGLIVVTNTKREIYQLRRSYNIKYDEEREQHIIEVIYNVKNYSSEDELPQNWLQEITLLATIESISSLVHPDLDKFKDNEDLLLRSRIKTLDGLDIELAENTEVEIKFEGLGQYSDKVEGNKISIRDQATKTLGPRQRQSWKIQYRFKKSK